MKQIRIYMLHTSCHDVESMLNYLQLTFLKSEFNFLWDESSPDYLITTEQIYNISKIRNLYNRIHKKVKITIFYTREAVTPDFNLCDYAVGFDYGLSYDDRYIQLPTPFELYPAFLTRRHNEIRSMKEAQNVLAHKSEFCNFLYSNHLAHPNRDLLFRILSKYKRVDSLGKHLNNVKLSGTGYKGHENDCIAIKAPYKFSIASENASFTGYTSEKILTSLAAHTIPIYFGDPMIKEKVNPDCFINCNDLKDLNEVVKLVKEVDENDELWCKMVSAPWQTKEQEEQSKECRKNYTLFFYKIFAYEIETVKRLPVGCRPDMYAYQFFHEHIHHKSLLERIYKRLVKSYIKR